VLLNEVQYDPLQPGIDASFEWVELFNCTQEPVELEGWVISDNYGSDPVPSLTLLPQGFAVIASAQDFYTNFPDFTGTIAFVEDGRIGNGLNNDGDCLILEDSAGTIIDAMSYGDDDSILLPSCEDVAEGHSLERQPAGFDTDHASDFVDNPNPTPGHGLATPTPTPTPTTDPASTPTPTLTPTAGHTATPIATPTATPTTSPPSSPTPEGTKPPPEASLALPGWALRAVFIVAALILFAVFFWFGIRRMRK